MSRGTERKAALGLYGATDTGKARRHNEDSFGCDDALGAAVVADGMGGLEGGEVASRMVVDIVMQTLRDGGDAAAGLADANQRILEARSSRGGPMGSTAVVVRIVGTEAHIHWVGDSRAYLLRERELRQITRDHSFVQELVEAQAITPEEAAIHPSRNIVTRAIGVMENDDLKVDTVTVPLRAGDRLLLCSDGLHGYLGETAIAQTLRACARCEDVPARLVQRTLEDSDAGDNVTVVCVCVG